MTTQNNTTTEVELMISNTKPDLGPPLRFVLWMNDEVITEGQIGDTPLHLKEKAPVKDGDNHLIIEHVDRQDSNTETDDKGVVTNTAMICIDKVRINRVSFFPDHRFPKNVFEPKYDDNYIEWAKQNQPSSNFPMETKATKHIGIMGKQKIYFMWPLHLHEMYYILHGQRPDFEF